MSTIRNECFPNRPAPAMNRSVSAPANPAGAHELRRRLAQTLAEWGEHEDGDIAELLAAELLGNAVQHAQRALASKFHERLRRLW